MVCVWVDGEKRWQPFVVSVGLEWAEDFLKPFGYCCGGIENLCSEITV
jgi:hypothetical protein